MGMHAGDEEAGRGTAARAADARSSLFAAPGEMAERCRALDWSATSLGAPETWPAALRTAVRTCLESPFPVNLWCGPELLLVYNDAYRRVLGAKHPRALGRPGLEVWADIRADVEPMFARIRAGGPAVYAENARFVMARAGRDDEAGLEAYFTFGLSAVRDEAGEIVAFFNPAAETTAQVLAERRLADANRAIAEANEQLEGQQVELELTNQQLQDTTVELEVQAAELQAATAEREAERGRLARIVERLPVGVKVVDRAGVVVTRNGALERVFGHAVRESVVMDMNAGYGALHPDGRRYARDDYPIARALLHGETVLRELTRYRRGDGREVTLSISAAPLRDEAGMLEGAVAAIEDVSDLERARAAAEEANRAKTQFLANMSHELRTPLNAIQGHLQLLEMELHGPLEPRQHETIARIDRAQRHLLGLINDILGYARLESGRVEYDVQPTLVADVVRDVLPIVEPLLLAKRLTFATELPEGRGEAPVPVWADREKLAQVLLNLLSNAVKFTPPDGTVTVEVATPAGDGATSELAYVHVRDTGIGVPADKLDAIFEPFVQVRSAYVPGQGGTGLGLTISRDLTRGMGGDLRARSAEGAGSTFTIALRRVVPRDADATERRSGEERRVDDERRSGEERREGAERG